MLEVLPAAPAAELVPPVVGLPPVVDLPATGSPGSPASEPPLPLGSPLNAPSSSEPQAQMPTLTMQEMVISLKVLMDEWVARSLPFYERARRRSHTEVPSLQPTTEGAKPRTPRAGHQRTGARTQQPVTQ